ncbi:histone superfamily protein [Actinidia rufa]|uniref:Histone superfamily protein n=1 Tax=Actinidia rufa TaxID=165716 RepID=A0A7J0F767_9ERIC|nr:histone superfamily protein [Actinidia rufa]
MVIRTKPDIELVKAPIQRFTGSPPTIGSPRQRRRSPGAQVGGGKEDHGGGEGPGREEAEGEEEAAEGGAAAAGYKKKRTKKIVETYKIYIFKELKQVHPDI